MANLLSTAERQVLRTERFKRLGICALIGILITFAIGSVLLVPSYLSATSREKTTQERLDALTKLIELKQGDSSDTAIRDTQDRLEILASALEAQTPSELLLETTGNTPAGVTIWQYSYSTSDTTITISISGRAANRAALLSFGEALRASGLFVSVDIPISTLARSEDIAFTLSLDLVTTTP